MRLINFERGQFLMCLGYYLTGRVKFQRYKLINHPLKTDPLGQNLMLHRQDGY